MVVIKYIRGGLTAAAVLAMGMGALVTSSSPASAKKDNDQDGPPFAAANLIA